MEDYKGEDWIALYQAALTELEDAKIAGRIDAAQKSIVARIELLRALPGLHAEERVALDDAMHALASLQREAARFDAEAQRRAIEESLEKLRSVAHTIQRLRERANDSE